MNEHSLSTSAPRGKMKCTEGEVGLLEIKKERELFKMFTECIFNDSSCADFVLFLNIGESFVCLLIWEGNMLWLRNCYPFKRGKPSLFKEHTVKAIAGLNHQSKDILSYSLFPENFEESRAQKRVIWLNILWSLLNEPFFTWLEIWNRFPV